MRADRLGFSGSACTTVSNANAKASKGVSAARDRRHPANRIGSNGTESAHSASNHPCASG